MPRSYYNPFQFARMPKPSIVAIIAQRNYPITEYLHPKIAERTDPSDVREMKCLSFKLKVVERVSDLP